MSATEETPEPLNDKEFEARKNLIVAFVHQGRDCHVTQNDYDRLVATVELQKSDLTFGAELVHRIQELKKENAKLAQENVMVYLDNKRLKEENAKLKAELDATLKRIEEME